MKAGRGFEELAARIYAELAAEASVTLDDSIVGESGVARQVDVTVRQQIAGVEVLIAIDTKDYRRPADVGKVDEFANKLRDIRANKGILICKSGFSKGALTSARKWGIELVNLHDTDSAEWHLDVRLPILWTELLPSVRWELVVKLEAGDSFENDPLKWKLVDRDGRPHDLVGSFVEAWNSLRLPRDPDMLHEMPATGQELSLLVTAAEGTTCGRRIHSLQLRYQVGTTSYLGSFTPDQCRGVLNYHDGKFLPSYLPVGAIPAVRDPDWPRVDNPDRLAIDPLGPLVITETWQVDSSSLRASVGDVTYLGADPPVA